MVDSFAQDGWEGVRDALERDDEDARADAVRAGCRRGAIHDDGAVRALRDQPDDWAQLAPAVPPGWGEGLGGSSVSLSPWRRRVGGYSLVTWRTGQNRSSFSGSLSGSSAATSFGQRPFCRQ